MSCTFGHVIVVAVLIMLSDVMKERARIRTTPFCGAVQNEKTKRNARRAGLALVAF